MEQKQPKKRAARLLARRARAEKTSEGHRASSRGVCLPPGWMSVGPSLRTIGPLLTLSQPFVPIFHHCLRVYRCRSWHATRASAFSEHHDILGPSRHGSATCASACPCWFRMLVHATTGSRSGGALPRFPTDAPLAVRDPLYPASPPTLHSRWRGALHSSHLLRGHDDACEPTAYAVDPTRLCHSGVFLIPFPFTGTRRAAGPSPSGGGSHAPEA